MTKIQCRYGKANFELTKACLASHDADLSGKPSPPPNFARHFSRIQAAMKIRSRHGEKLPAQTSPRYSPLPDAAEHLAREKAGRAAAAQAAASHAATASTHDDAASLQALAAEERAPRPPRTGLPQLSVAITSGLLAIGIAIVVGLAIGRGGAFRNAGAPMLPPFGARHAAAGPIVHPGSEPATASAEASAGAPATEAASEPASSVALIEKPTEVPAAPSGSAEAEKETPLAAPPQRKMKAAKTEAPHKTRHARKKKHKQARSAPPAKQNPFTGDKPPYSAQAPSGTRDRLEQCKHLSSLIRSELCRWRICKNKWGRDGCPAYEQASPGSVGLRPGLRPYRARLN